MLRDGYFIKEDPPKIGAHYTPQFFTKPTTPEERLVQDIVLGQPMSQRSNVITRIFGRLLTL